MSTKLQVEVRLEPCLECCLMAVRKGDSLNEDDACYDYYCYSQRCYHCVVKDHDCIRIQNPDLRRVALDLYDAIADYFTAPSLPAARLVFFYQEFFLEMYALVGDLEGMSQECDEEQSFSD
ncbi:hypothetical protein ACHAPJ_013595 [Fusarium lateritium]